MGHFQTINENGVPNFIIKFKGCFQIIFVKCFGYLRQFLLFIAGLVEAEFQDFRLDFRYNLFRLIFLVAFIHGHTTDF